MAKYKTLDNLLSQNSWSGADIGKIILLKYIDYCKTGEEIDEALQAKLEENIEYLSHKEEQIFNAYNSFRDSLSFYYPQVATRTAQIIYAQSTLLNYLDTVIANYKEYKNYLKQPLIISKKVFNELKAQKDKETKEKSFTAYEFLIMYISDLLNLFFYEKESIGPELQKILKSYLTQNIEFPVSLYTSSENEDLYFQNLLDNFSKVYKTKNTPKAIIDFIEEDTIGACEPLGIVSSKKITPEHTRDLIKRYENYKYCESLYKESKDFKSVFTGLAIGEEKGESLKVSKLRALFAYNELNGLLEYRYSESQPLEELQAEFIKNYPELYNFVKADLGQRLDIFNRPDKELTTEKITNDQLQKANILDFVDCEDSTELKLIREWILEKEPKNQSEFLLQEKALAGICIQVTPPTPEQSETYNKYADFKIIPDSVEKNINTITAQYIRFRNGLSRLQRFNDFIDIYSDILKVDLSPLKADTDTTLLENEFNSELYLFYRDITGDKKTLTNNRAEIKSIFKQLKNTTANSKNDIIKELKREVKELAGKDLNLAVEISEINKVVNIE